jgi:predicted DNA-binding transcriptional regulator YafY
MDVADLDEVKRWLMGFGASAEVLAPLELRRMVTEELGLAIEMYEHHRTRLRNKLEHISEK